ncbi:MAG: hypothetical protein ACI8XB_001266 [Patiriisocius sp.]|jgi:hypothetical protein
MKRYVGLTGVSLIWLRFFDYFVMKWAKELVNSNNHFIYFMSIVFESLAY